MSSLLEGRAADAPRERLADALGQLRPVADLGDERQGVVVAAELVPVRSGALCRNSWKRDVGLGAAAGPGRRSTPAGQRAQLLAGTRCPGGTPPPAWPRSGGRLRSTAADSPAARAALAPALPLEPGQRELDVLAGAQRVDGEIGAGAEVLAQALRRGSPRDRSASVCGIGDLELREDRLVAEVLQAELLLAAELPPQGDLPVFQRHVLRLAQAGDLLRPWRSTADRSGRPQAAPAVPGSGHSGDLVAACRTVLGAMSSLRTTDARDGPLGGTDYENQQSRLNLPGRCRRFNYPPAPCFRPADLSRYHNE